MRENIPTKWPAISCLLNLYTMENVMKTTCFFHRDLRACARAHAVTISGK